MNINNVNNALAGGELNKGARITGQKDTERTEQTVDREKVQRPEAENRAADTAPSRPATDVFESTENRRLAAELVKNLGAGEPEPREDAVSRAQERVRSGYYNTPEFQNRLAMRLVETGITQ